MVYSRLRSTLKHLLLLKEMQIVSTRTCNKGNGQSMAWHRRHRGGSLFVVLLVLNGVVNARLRPLYARDRVPVPIVQEAWPVPLDGYEKPKQAYMYNTTATTLIWYPYEYRNLFSFLCFQLIYFVLYELWPIDLKQSRSSP